MTKENDILDITKQTHQNQIQQPDAERLQALRYMDDSFMTVCLADNFEGVGLILRIVLGRDDITIKSVRTQELMKNLQGRSVVLDVHAIDSTDREFDVEIQRANAGAGAKRARYNSSLLDAHIIKPGTDTENIPDSYVIFITENDVLNGNQPIYPVERYIAIGEEQELFGDGSHILYVNGQYRGNDAIGKLMHDFSCTDPDDMHYEALAKRARYFKQNEKGVTVMSSVLDDIRNEGELKNARENAERIIKKGKMTIEEIAECIPLLSLDELREIETRVTPSA